MSFAEAFESPAPFDVAPERRRDRRWPAELKIMVVRQEQGRRAIAGMLLDVSVAGISIKTATKLKVGENLTVVLFSNSSEIVTEQTAVVRYVNAIENDLFRTGLQFRTRLSPDDMQMMLEPLGDELIVDNSRI